MTSGLPAEFQEKFEKLHCSGDQSTRDAIVKTSKKMYELFHPSTRLCFCELVGNILYDLFWEVDEENEFCEAALLTVCLAMDVKLASHMRMLNIMKTGNLATNESLLETIHNDPSFNDTAALMLMTTLFVCSIQNGYDSRSRVLLKKLAEELEVEWDQLELLERTVCQLFMNKYYQEAREEKWLSHVPNKYKVDPHSITIGIIDIVLSLTQFASIIGPTLHVGSFCYNHHKQLSHEDFPRLEVEKITDKYGFHCSMFVGGWIDEDVEEGEEFSYHWRHARMAEEQYVLHYNTAELKDFGGSWDWKSEFTFNNIISSLKSLKSILLTGTSGDAIGEMINSQWSTLTARTDKVGKQLADDLLERPHGKRPISLVGFSIGARVIFKCLMELSTRSERQGIIEDVILLGTPICAKEDDWEMIRKVVAGRLVNGYSSKDDLLKFGLMNTKFKYIGGRPVEVADELNIENVDLSDIVDEHVDYGDKLTEILDLLDVPVSEEWRDMEDVTTDSSDEDESEVESSEESESDE